MTRAERIIAFAHRYLRVPEGALVGQSIKLDPFQIDFIKAVYDNPRRQTRRAILSMARKNGKTVLIAILVLAHLVGPEAKQNSQIVSGAMSRDQAAIVFELASKMVMMSPELSKIVRIVPSGKRLHGLLMNTEYRALSAEGKTAHGLSPVVAILDEVGQVQGAQSDFVDAIITSQGAHENPLQLIISTQAANDADLLSIWIDDAKKSDDPSIVCKVYEAPKECDVMDEAGWLAANPALGIFRSTEDVREQATQASRMPSMEATFRNLILNQRVSVNAPFISKSAWLACGGDVCPIEECEELYGGLDLSAKTDLTAFVMLGKRGREWHSYSHFFTPERGLHDRAKKDKAPYDVWVAQGLINAVPGASVDYEYVARYLAELVEGLPLISIAYDRWRMDIMQKELERIGVELPLYEWGQGFKDMAPALDALEGMILNEQLRHGNNPVLTMCAANAVLAKNPAGDRKLEKMKISGRIDGMVALAMAAGVAERLHEVEGDISDFLKNPLVF